MTTGAANERPMCPEHKVRALNARTPTTSERMYICPVCGKSLGPAPSDEGHGVPELMTLQGSGIASKKTAL